MVRYPLSTQDDVPPPLPARDGSADPDDIVAVDVATRLAAVAERVFATVAGLRQIVEGVLADRVPVRRADLLPLEGPATAALSDPHAAVVGAGYVAAPGVLADSAYWLEWWTRGAADATRDIGGPVDGVVRLVVETDAGADTFRDYTSLPWFSGPRRTSTRQVTGPYVDYLCTDEYIVTFTSPVRGPAGFAGVVGCDVQARYLERLLVPRLASITSPACVVNSSGRIVASNRPTLVTGSLLRDACEAPARPPLTPVPTQTGDGTWVVCPDLPLAVLVRRPSPASAGHRCQ